MFAHRWLGYQGVACHDAMTGMSYISKTLACSTHCFFLDCPGFVLCTGIKGLTRYLSLTL